MTKSCWSCWCLWLDKHNEY